MQSKEETKEKEENQIPIKAVYSKLVLAHFSDTHNYHDDIKWEYDISKVDVAVCSGDITSIGSKKDVEKFMSWFKALPTQYKVLIAGNHDRTFDPFRGGNTGSKPDWIIDLINDFQKHDSLNFYLENSSCKIEGVKFWGSPHSAIFHGEKWAFNLKRGRESFDVYSKIPIDTDVLITHGPPYGKNDWGIFPKEPLGCLDLEYHVKRVKPLLHLYGHIHEAHGYMEGVDTHYFNGSICNLAYDPVNTPWIIEADFQNKEVNILNENT